MASESEDCETENVIVSEEALNMNEEEEGAESELVTVVEFNEGLIYLIQERPVLWDNRERGYSDRAVKMAAWEEIANIVNKDVETIQKRWLSLRDRYARELKKMRNLENQGLSQCVTRQWGYFDLLAFLRDVVKPRSSKPVEKRSYVPIVYKDKTKTNSNMSIDTSWRETTLVRTNNSPQITLKSKSPTPSYIEQDLTDSKPSIQLKRKLPSGDDDMKLSSRESGLLSQDPDEAFCTSLIHYFKVLSPQKKIRAQIDILQVLQGNM